MSLAALQRWMLAAITRPTPRQILADTQSLPGEPPVDLPVDQVLRASRAQTADERLAIYQSAYFARLIEVMRELFPCLRQAVGDEVFDQFALGYLVAQPPTSYTLARLADRFVEHLAQSEPPDAPWAGFLSELAALERAIDETFDGPGPEDVPPLNWNPGQFPDPANLRLVPAIGWRLLAFQYPVSTYYTSWKKGEAAQWPAPQPQYVALQRRDYVVRRHELTSSQHAVLTRLASGMDLAGALDLLANDEHHPPPSSADIQQWFTQWAASGFFAGVK
jgi:hypothetical protein